MLDTAGEDEAEVDVLSEKEKPEGPLVVPEEAAVLVTLKPEREAVEVAVLGALKAEKDTPLPEEVAETVGVAVEAVLAEAVRENPGTDEDAIEPLEAGVEVVVAVTVENNGADDVVKENDFVAEGVGVPNEKLEGLDEEDVRDGAEEGAAAVDADGFADAELVAKEKPEEAENGEAEPRPVLAEKGLEKEEVDAAEEEADEPYKFAAGNALVEDELGVAAEDEADEPNKFAAGKALVENEVVVAAEDEADEPNKFTEDEKGEPELAEEEATPNGAGLEPAAADEDAENKEAPELAKDADEPNKGDADELADEADPKLDNPEPVPKREEVEDAADEGEAEAAAEDANPNDGAGAEAAIEVENGEEEEEAEADAVFKEKETEGAEEEELGFEEDKPEKGEGPNEKPPADAEDPNVEGDDPNENPDGVDEEEFPNGDEACDEEEAEEDPNEKPDIVARSLYAKCWGFENHGFSVQSPGVRL
ncbi:hypothetical protein L6164_003597 [Bauhinia variegata]|uniref:Uncharacterized protein n=1 Tax=Bauhinia variegata TaxID=167791 RepID=A0ACB9Q3T3_BAUVA|nr:hypothetical protein L6164_003597 [Bauhinia variegata]